MKTKREHRLFFVSSFMEEQNYLMKMHQIGWKLKSYGIMKGYLFEECAQEEWIYELDFKNDDSDVNSYLQLFLDCGWEYVITFNSFYYFRKKKSDDDVDTSIFSDDQSRYDLCTRMLPRLAFTFVILGSFLMIILIPNFISNYEHYLAMHDYEYFIVQCILFLCYVSMIIVTIGAIIKLLKIQKKFSSRIE